jgi:hypothetical protein
LSVTAPTAESPRGQWGDAVPLLLIDLDPTLAERG